MVTRLGNGKTFSKISDFFHGTRMNITTEEAMTVWMELCYTCLYLSAVV
jgi:hypothetical protein